MARAAYAASLHSGEILIEQQVEGADQASDQYDRMRKPARITQCQIKKERRDKDGRFNRPH